MILKYPVFPVLFTDKSYDCQGRSRSCVILKNNFPEENKSIFCSDFKKYLLIAEYFDVLMDNVLDTTLWED